MLAKFKLIRNFAALTLLICGVTSNISAYNIQDVQTLVSTKQCLNCDFENYANFWDIFYDNLHNVDVSGSNLRRIQLNGYLSNVNFSNTDLSGSKLQILIGGVVGAVSTLGSGLLTTSAIGGISNVGGDIALKASTGHFDQITWTESAIAAAKGVLGAVISNKLGYLKFPNRKLPEAHATFPNYGQPTIRQFAYQHSEVIDGMRRNI